MGPHRQALCLRRPAGPRNAGRPVRRQKPTHRLPFHARARLAGGLQELLLCGRSFRRRHSALGRARRYLAGDFARAAGRDRGLPDAHGVEVQVAVVARQRLQLRLQGLVSRGPGWRGRDLQFRHDEGLWRGNAGHQRLCPQRGGGGVSHLLDLCPRPRRRRRHLSVARSGAERPRRRRPPLHHVVGETARRIRAGAARAGRRAAAETPAGLVCELRERQALAAGRA